LTNKQVTTKVMSALMFSPRRLVPELTFQEALNKDKLTQLVSELR